MVIRDGGAGGDGAHAVNDAGGGEHSLTEHGFSGGSMAYDCEVTNLTRLVFFHNKSLTVPSMFISANALSS